MVGVGTVVALSVAATPVTLEQVRKESRENTAALQQALAAESARAGVTGARSALLPQLSVSSGVSRSWNDPSRTVTDVPDPDNEGRSIQQVRGFPAYELNSYSLQAVLNQSLVDLGRWARLAESGARADAAKGQAVEQAATSELEGIRRFFELYRTQAALQVLEATVRRSEEQVQRAQALYEAGRAPKQESLSAQVNLGNDRIQLLLRQSQLASAQANLAVWLRRPGTEELQATGPSPIETAPPPPPAFEETLQTARAQRPLLRALQRQVDAADASRKVALTGYLPRLNAQASYSRGSESLDIFGDPSLNSRYQVGVNLQWDVFNSFNTVSQVRQATAERSRSELELAQAERDLEGEVKRSHAALALQVQATEVARANLDTARQSLALAEERFRAGAGSTLEVRDAQLSLTQAELNLLQNRIDVEVARYALERAAGRLGSGEGT